MKISHFNGFDEDHNFRRQLKQKMQNFEPEVSNTLWDRIELNLANQEEKKSKKGLWLLVWFLSIGFTAMLTWGVYDYTSTNKSTKISVQNENPLYVKSENTQKLPLVNSNDNGNEIASKLENNSSFTENNNSTENLRADNNMPKKSNSSIGNHPNNNLNPNHNSIEDNVTLYNSEKNITGNEPKNNDLKTPKNINPKESKMFPLAKITDPQISFLAITDGNNESKPTSPEVPKKPKTGNKKLNLERFSIVFNQLSAYNYRTVKTVEGSTPIPESPREADKNNYEKGAYTYNNYNFGLEYNISNHWNISVGYGIYNFQNTVQYDSLRRDPSSPPIGSAAWYGNEKDSVAIGNGKTYTSTWNMSQIPVEITYKNNITNKLTYIVGTGIEYNIVKNYMYHMFDAKFRNDFIPIEKGNSYDQHFTEAGFKNYVSVQLRAGAEYQIFNRLSIRVNAYGSKAIQSYSKDESGISTKPYRFGLQTGLIFSLK